MYLVAILVTVGWMYVALMMAVVEATSPQGSVLGAAFTFLMYGVAPVALLLYILGTPGRKRRLRQAANEGGHAPGTSSSADPVAPEREEP